MKKKGLIVATIVMVLVLAVSLTTATYAWFTAIDETTITDIAFQVSAGSDVIIGIKQDGAYDADATEAHFWSNGTVFDGSEWSGDVNGFGQSIDTGLDLSGITQAIGTGTAAVVDGENITPGTVAAAWDLDTENYIVIKANGTNNIADGKTATAAVANGYQPTEGSAIKGDYLDIVLGVKPAKSNLKSITLNVTVNPQDNGAVIGMNSAIHVIYGIDQAAPTKPVAGAYETGVKSGEIDVYDEYHYGKRKADISAASTFAAQGLSTATTALNPGWINIPIEIVAVDSGYLEVDTFYQIHIIIFIAGYDSDCVQSAMGVAANISLNFTAVEEGE